MSVHLLLVICVNPLQFLAILVTLVYCYLCGVFLS